MARRFLTAFIVTTLITGGYFYYLKTSGEQQLAASQGLNKLETAAGPNDPSATAPFTLTDQNGKKVTEKDLQGKKLLVYFGFTRCPDICPVSMAVLTEVMNQLTPDKSKNMQPIFISIDPQNDTPEVLKAYLKDYYSGFMALTGSQEEVDKVKKSFRVYAENTPAKLDEHDEMNDHAQDHKHQDLPGHSNLIYYMDENGKYLTHFTSDSAPEDIVDYISSH